MRPTRSGPSVSNFPLAYKLSWLPRLLNPSLAGDRSGFAPPAGTLLEPFPTRTVRLVFVGDISAVANRAAPVVDPEIHDLLGAADLVVGNCESPVVEKVRAPLGTALGIRHAMGERFLVETLEAAGIAREFDGCGEVLPPQFDQIRARLERAGVADPGPAEPDCDPSAARGGDRERAKRPIGHHPLPGELAGDDDRARESDRATGRNRTRRIPRMNELVLIVVLTLVAAAGTAVVMTNAPERQAVTFAYFGITLTLLFLALQAPDVALSQLAVGTAFSPLMVMLAIRKIRRGRS